MTKQVVWDADCFSAFLEVEKIPNVVMLLRGNKLIMPGPVYEEICAARNEGWKETIDQYIRSKIIVIKELYSNEEITKTYYKLRQHPDEGHLEIGSGEAAAIAIAKDTGAVLLSNNLKDIKQYVVEYNLKHATTGTILYDMYRCGGMDKKEIEIIWNEMYSRGIKLPAQTFQEYVDKELWNIQNRYSFELNAPR